MEEDHDAGEAALAGAAEADAEIFGAEVPPDAELDAEFAARACPVDAIELYDDDGEQVV